MNKEGFVNQLFISDCLDILKDLYNKNKEGFIAPLLILTICLLSFNCFSQKQNINKKQSVQPSQNQSTIEETKAFIKKYIELYPQNNSENHEVNQVKFLEQQDFGLVMTYQNNLGPLMGVYNWAFRVKDIESITVDMLTLKDQNCILKLYLSANHTADKRYNDEATEQVQVVKIYLGNASFTDNYPDRIEKALEHLVFLSRGKILKDKF